MKKYDLVNIQMVKMKWSINERIKIIPFAILLQNETHGAVAQDEGSRRECASNKHPENLFVSK